MSYTTDLSDRQFRLVEKYLPVKKITRPRKYELKDLINGMLYILKTGCQWRLLPDGYPPFRLVHSYFRKLVLGKYLDNLLFELNKLCKTRLARTKQTRSERETRVPVNPYPSLLITDSKSIDSSEWLNSKHAGYDGHKKVKGVKLFLLVDKLGFCWRCLTTPANQSELKGVTTLIDHCLYSRKRPVGVKVVVGDRYFDSKPLRLDMKKRHDLIFEALKKRPATKFKLPEQQEQDTWREREKKRIINSVRYVVEQVFSHLTKARRLVNVYERCATSYLGFVKLRFVSLLLGRLSRIAVN